MGEGFHLVELCCGSAALTMHLLGKKKQQVVPYQGSKWKYRRELAQILADRGHTQLDGTLGAYLVRADEPADPGAGHRSTRATRSTGPA
jgi:hypothetical protein